MTEPYRLGNAGKGGNRVTDEAVGKATSQARLSTSASLPNTLEMVKNKKEEKNNLFGVSLCCIFNKCTIPR
jgi:hypothetical protein